MDRFTQQGMARVDRGLRAATALFNISYVIGGLGALGSLALAVSATKTDTSAGEDSTAYILGAVLIGFQTLVVVVVFRALGSIVELLSGHYELDLLETDVDEDDSADPAPPGERNQPQ